MSADEFDPAIERLFARAPSLPDAPLFTAEVEQRLQRGSRLRFLILGLASVLGLGVAAREVLTVRLSAEPGESAALVGHGLQAASVNAQSALQGGLDRFGLGSMDLAPVGGMQLFWLAAAGLIAAASVGLFRLSQEV